MRAPEPALGNRDDMLQEWNGHGAWAGPELCRNYPKFLNGD